MTKLHSLVQNFRKRAGGKDTGDRHDNTDNHMHIKRSGSGQQNTYKTKTFNEQLLMTVTVT